MNKMLLFLVFRTVNTAYQSEFLALGLRSYVLGLKFLQSQLQNSCGVESLTPECSGVRPLIITAKIRVAKLSAPFFFSKFLLLY